MKWSWLKREKFMISVQLFCRSPPLLGPQIILETCKLSSSPPALSEAGGVSSKFVSNTTLVPFSLLLLLTLLLGSTSSFFPLTADILIWNKNVSLVCVWAVAQDSSEGSLDTDSLPIVRIAKWQLRSDTETCEHLNAWPGTRGVSRRKHLWPKNRNLEYDRTRILTYH